MSEPAISRFPVPDLKDLPDDIREKMVMKSNTRDIPVIELSGVYVILLSTIWMAEWYYRRRLNLS